jgi:hypothetical protein
MTMSAFSNSSRNHNDKLRTFADPPTPVGTVRMHVLEPPIPLSFACVLEKYQSSLLSLSCLPTSAFSRSPVPIALLLPSLSRYGAGECPGAVASA